MPFNNSSSSSTYVLAPKSVFLRPELRVDTEFYNNSINESFPQWVSNLSSLKTIRFDLTGVTGSLPEDIGRLSNLERMFITRNPMTPNIPESIGQLSQLYELKLKGINLTENFGQHNAIMAGLNNCTGEYIITMDDDLQHPPEFILNILDK